MCWRDIDIEPFLSANSGAAAGGIAFFITYIPNFFIQMRYQDVNGPTKWATSILHNVAMSYGCTQIAAYEGAGTCCHFLIDMDITICALLCRGSSASSVWSIRFIYIYIPGCITRTDATTRSTKSANTLPQQNKESVRHVYNS